MWENAFRNDNIYIIYDTLYQVLFSSSHIYILYTLLHSVSQFQITKHSMSQTMYNKTQIYICEIHI